MKVFIGIGHGGKDPGVIANGMRESDVNLDMGLELRRQLDRHGVQTAISRSTDANDPIEEEIAEANGFQPDIAVDVHDNAGGGDGFEVFVQSCGCHKTKLRALAAVIEKEVLRMGQNSRGIKTKLNSAGSDYYGFLRQSKTVAVILEGAFLDNDKDVPAIDTLTGRKAFGTAYAKGILAYAGITWIEEKPALPDWQMEGLKVLQAAKIIEDPDYWVPRMAKNITVGEVVGLLGKVITGR